MLKARVKLILMTLLAALFLSACGGNHQEGLISEDHGQGILPDDNSQSVIAPEATETGLVKSTCVQIFYDRTNLAGIENGKLYAIMVANLLGHFPDLQRVISPIELYHAGDLDRCDSNIYISSFYGNRIPRAFLDEFVTTKSRVAWVGYNFWKLYDDLDYVFGVTFDSLQSLDTVNLDANSAPGFYKDVIYKGETFSKQFTWTPSTSTFTGASEVSKLHVTTPAKHQVLAKIKHSSTGAEIPWAIRAGNKFLISEVPLSYLHEGDRYLVFADLLFDIVGKQAQHNGKYAVVRLEDIHPFVDQSLLSLAFETLKSENIPAHLSMIPIFRDPLDAFPRADMTKKEVLMTEVPDFLALIQSFQTQGASFIWHGVTHQTDELQNPFTGTSGDDYEFWDYSNQSPIAQDSADYVLNKLEWGAQVFRQAGITPKLWLTPHYQASALDNIIFAQVFNWTIGRMTYSDFERYGLRLNLRPELIRFPDLDSDSVARRQFHFQDLVVFQNSEAWIGQFFPYEIHQDIYGQKVIPENLGNVQPALNVQVVHTRQVSQILADAKRNLVLRDVWASAFFHPFLLEGQTLATNDLRALVVGLKNLGYDFINLEQYAAAHTEQRLPSVLDLEQIRH